MNSHGIILYRSVLEVGQLKGNAFLFFPSAQREFSPAYAIFAHGYTSHKGSLLNWGTRLAEKGIPTCLFDLPGHYLGGYHDVDHFEEFSAKAHHLFVAAKIEIEKILKDHYPLESDRFLDPATKVSLILGGHSLGALLSLKAMSLAAFDPYPKMAIGVGFGQSYSKNNRTHLFETDFYQKTLEIRKQLVSPAIAPEFIFPWIKNEKNNLMLTGQSIFLVTGEDDLVATPDRVQELAEYLRSQQNTVDVEIPQKLAHHLPELAASYLMKFIKKKFPHLTHS